MNDDHGHDHVHHSPRDCGRGEVRQGQSQWYCTGRVEEEGGNCPGEERNIWYLVRCYTVRGQCHIINSMYDIIYSVYYTLYLGKL